MRSYYFENEKQANTFEDNCKALAFTWNSIFDYCEEIEISSSYSPNCEIAKYRIDIVDNGQFNQKQWQEINRWNFKADQLK